MHYFSYKNLTLLHKNEKKMLISDYQLLYQYYYKQRKFVLIRMSLYKV